MGNRIVPEIPQEKQLWLLKTNPEMFALNKQTSGESNLSPATHRRLDENGEMGASEFQAFLESCQALIQGLPPPGPGISTGLNFAF